MRSDTTLSSDPADLDPPATAAELAWRRQQIRPILRKAILKTLALVGVFGAGLVLGPSWDHRHTFWLRILSVVVAGGLIAMFGVNEIRTGLKSGRNVQLKRLRDAHDVLNRQFLEALDER